MRKILIVLLICVLAAVSLTGCGQKNDAAESADAPEESRIHVTFGENKNLDVRYFADESHKSPLALPCYLNPGDSVYAEVIVNGNGNNPYEFSGFRAFEIDGSGSYVETDSVKSTNTDTNYVLSVAADYQGSDLAVEPIGEFKKRTVTLNDSCFDSAENKITLNGTWFVDNEEHHGGSVELSSRSSHDVRYQYDSEKYFFVSCEPESFYNDSANGEVIFKQLETSDRTTEYTVELHEYLTVTLVSETDRKVCIGDEPERSVKANTELPVEKLRYGQTVRLKTDKEWPALENRNKELIVTDREGSPGNYTYTLTVPEKGGEFDFSPSDYKYEHGTVSFSCFGSVVTGLQKLAKGSRIYYEQNTAEDGWWLAPGDGNYVTVGEKDATERALQNIHFTEKVPVTVTLEQPQYGGTVTYRADGKRIDTSEFTTYSGTRIEMEFDPWSGWILDSNAHDGDEYVVNEANQLAHGDGYTIGSVFKEDKDHMPLLTVTLEKSVGKDMEFSFSASGFKTDISSYGGGWKPADIIQNGAGKYNLITNSQDIISQQKIGTQIPIMMTMGNRALQAGQAVRFVIEKTDSAGRNESVTNYVTDMTAKLEPIYIYPPEEQPSSKIWYKSVHITVGVIDIEEFKTPSKTPHTTVLVEHVGTNTYLTDGELIEGAQKVTVTIEPDAGYYITGKDVTNDVYRKTMTYSEYTEKLADIIEKHKAARYLTITPDASDAFAMYTYKLDGRDVSGETRVKEGQTLTLTYEITDGVHRLKEGAGGVPLVGWGKSYTKVSKSLTITPALDGSTLTKADFGIEIEREGESK